MSASGQKRTFSNVCLVSALPPKADIDRWHRGSLLPDTNVTASALQGICAEPDFAIFCIPSHRRKDLLLDAHNKNHEKGALGKLDAERPVRAGLLLKYQF